MLQSYNIETARDVTHAMAVPGFGPALKEKLMDWRRSVERRFRFDNTKGIDPRDVVSLDKEMSDQQAKYERTLASGAEELQRIRANVLAQRKLMEPQVNIAYAAMLKAEADMIAAKG